MDWVNDKLYWVDSLWARIEVMDISPSGNQDRAEVVKLTNHTIPRGIAVDPNSRLVLLYTLSGFKEIACVNVRYAIFKV